MKTLEVNRSKAHEGYRRLLVGARSMQEFPDRIRTEKLGNIGSGGIGLNLKINLSEGGNFEDQELDDLAGLR